MQTILSCIYYVRHDNVVGTTTTLSWRNCHNSVVVTTTLSTTLSKCNSRDNIVGTTTALSHSSVVDSVVVVPTGLSWLLRCDNVVYQLHCQLHYHNVVVMKI